MIMLQTHSFQLAAYIKGDKKADKLALALPGLLDTKDYLHLRSHVDFLADKGYLALSFDPPGTWESAGSISLYTVTNYLKAINELIDYFGHRPTFVMGHSRGGTMSLYTGVTNPSVFAFASVMLSHVNGMPPVMDDKVIHWREEGFRHEMRDLPPGGGPKVKSFDLPYSFFEDQTRYDMTDKLVQCAKPKLFIYGKYDNAATPEKVHSIYDIAPEPKKIAGINSDHNYRHHTQLIAQVNRIIGDFLDTYTA